MTSNPVLYLQSSDGGQYVAESSAMQALLSEALMTARGSDHPILISGPIGSGKTHLARFIHGNSPRSAAPLEVIDCGALPELDNQLFGHEPGAFTGAERKLSGRLKAAHGGIVILDDFERLSLNQQDMLHRVVVDGSIVPIGANRTARVNLRFIAVTNKNVYKEVDAGRLRRDFVSRLDYLPLRVPPLSERAEDIPPLARELLRRNLEDLAAKGIRNSESLEFHEDCWPALKARTFEDNVRGLDKLIVRLVARVRDRRQIRPADIDAAAPHARSRQKDHLTPNRTLREVLAVEEREYIVKVLHHTGFNVLQAARVLGHSRKFVYDKMKLYEIGRPH